MTAVRMLFYRFYWQLERLITPSLRNSQYAYLDHLRELVSSRTRWLDLGCGHQLVPAWTKTDEVSITHRAALVVGVDGDEASLRTHKSIANRVVADIHALPFRDGTFNLTTANMVMEHIAQPRCLLSEIGRVLSPNGRLLFHTTNAQNYHTRIARLLPQGIKNKLALFLQGRREEDVYPTCYRFNTSKVICETAAAIDLRVRYLDRVNSSAETIMLGPLVIFELLLIRLSSSPRFAEYRNNIIAELEKPRKRNTGIQSLVM
jgi:ubiquinone/menaquinone biosynthesis C-methylase UbiE